MMTSDEQRVFDRMTRLLTEIAFIVKGDPHVAAVQRGEVGMMHSWHDLPILVQKLVVENVYYKAHIDRMQTRLETVAVKLEQMLGVVGDPNLGQD